MAFHSLPKEAANYFNEAGTLQDLTTDINRTVMLSTCHVHVLDGNFFVFQTNANFRYDQSDWYTITKCACYISQIGALNR